MKRRYPRYQPGPARCSVRSSQIERGCIQKVYSGFHRTEPNALQKHDFMSQHNQMDRHGRGFRAYCLGFVTEEKDSMIGEDLRSRFGDNRFSFHQNSAEAVTVRNA